MDAPTLSYYDPTSKRWITRRPRATTIVHVFINDADGTELVFHAERVDAGSLLGELVELHETIVWTCEGGDHVILGDGCYYSFKERGEI